MFSDISFKDLVLSFKLIGQKSHKLDLIKTIQHALNEGKLRGEGQSHKGVIHSVEAKLLKS